MKKWLILMAIVILAFAVRVWRVNEIPPAMSWDEVSIGYNAYSILTTGKDEHGRLFPLDAFIAYGDYKPPLSIYATVPFVAVFGLNELAVRLPSVLAGTATVLLVYFLVLELLSARKIALLTSFLLAVSPWHLLLSRAGFEANIAVAFMVLGAWAILSSRRNPKRLVWAYLPFVAGIYTFNSARYFGPMLALGLTVFAWRQVIPHKRQLAMGLVIAAMLVVPIGKHLVSPESRLRLAEVNIFSDLPLVQQANARMAVDGNAIWAKALHNRRVEFARSYLLHFFDHLEPRFLFIRGDGNPKFSIQDVGQMYLVEAPFLVLGFLWIFAKTPRVGWLLVFWLLASIAPAAVARETPHALRIENSLPVWQLTTALGVFSFLEKRAAGMKKIFITILVLALAGNMAYFAHNYLNHYAKEFSGEWQYGYKQALEKISALPEPYDTIVLSEIIGRPYMYTLFYTKYDLQQFLSTRQSYFDASGFYHVDGFGKYRFTRTGIGQPGTYEGRTLYVLPPGEAPENGHIVDTVKLLNGTPVLVMFEL
jgi:4-amino-4-deoxy-L-arabinose transferase-like glycosyltransferase